MKNNETNKVEETVNSVLEIGIGKESVQQEELISQKKPKNKRMFIIAIIIATILIIIGILAYFFIQNNSKKEETINNDSINSSESNTNEYNSNSNMIDENLEESKTEEEKNDNFSNDMSNANVEYLNLSKIPIYKPDVGDFQRNEFSVGIINDDYVSAKIEIIDKRAYIVYGNTKTEIKNINNVKQVLATSYSACDNTTIFIYLLTTDGKLYNYQSDSIYYDSTRPPYDEEAFVYPKTKDELNVFVNKISSEFKEWDLTKKYTDISFGFVPCGPGCGCGINIIGTATDDKKYVINDSEKYLNDYYDFSYYQGEYGYYVSLDGKIHTNFWDRDRKENLDIKVLYFFEAEDYEFYFLSTDLYLYKIEENITKVKDVKVSKISLEIIPEDRASLIIYFNDGNKINMRANVIEF